LWTSLPMTIIAVLVVLPRDRVNRQPSKHCKNEPKIKTVLPNNTYKINEQNTHIHTRLADRTTRRLRRTKRIERTRAVYACARCTASATRVAAASVDADTDGPCSRFHPHRVVRARAIIIAWLAGRSCRNR